MLFSFRKSGHFLTNLQSLNLFVDKYSEANYLFWLVGKANNIIKSLIVLQFTKSSHCLEECLQQWRIGKLS